MRRASRTSPLLTFVVLTMVISATTNAIADEELEVLPVQGNVYMIAGGGGNTTVQVGPEAVVVVDTKTAAVTDRLLEAIRKLSSKPIRHIVVTSADPLFTSFFSYFLQFFTKIFVMMNFFQYFFADIFISM